VYFIFSVLPVTYILINPTLRTLTKNGRKFIYTLLLSKTIFIGPLSIFGKDAIAKISPCCRLYYDLRKKISWDINSQVRHQMFGQKHFVIKIAAKNVMAKRSVKQVISIIFLPCQLIHAITLPG
jgi:hypothetical protein